MKILLIDNGTKHLGKLKDLLAGNKIEISKLFSNYPDFNNFDLVILSGGSQQSLITAPEIFREEINRVKTSKTPILGICQGCEIIAVAFNSTLNPIEGIAKGVKEIEINNETLVGFPKKIQVYEAHHLAITTIGSELDLLGKSKYGIEIISHKMKKIIGFQFHPEMLTDTTSGDTIFRQALSYLFK